MVVWAGGFVVWMYKYGDMKVTRPQPDPAKGWVYRIGTGGYGTLEETQEADRLFNGGFMGFVLMLGSWSIRVQKLGQPVKAPNPWTFRDNG
jgi:hypothetical protein